MAYFDLFGLFEFIRIKPFFQKSQYPPSKRILTHIIIIDYLVGEICVGKKNIPTLLRSNKVEKVGREKQGKNFCSWLLKSY